jgi:hypothetical protein
VVDLSPDLSIYKNIGGQQLGVSDLLSIISKGRELSTQAGIAKALRDNPNDPMAASRAATQDPSVFMTPEQQAGFTHAQQAQYNLNKGYVNDTWAALANLATKPDANVNDFAPIAAGLAYAGVPRQAIQGIIDKATQNGGKLDQNQLLTLWSMSHGGAGLPTTPVSGVGGEQAVPTIAAQRPGGQAAVQAPVPTTRPWSAPPSPDKTTGKPVEDTADTAAKEVVANRFKPSGPPGSITTQDPNMESYKASEKRFAGEQDAATHYQEGVGPLQKMVEILRKDPNATGRGTDLINDLKNWANTLGLIDKADLDKVVDFESFRKYAAQNVLGGSMGGTDARMAETITGSPNVHLLGQTNMGLAQYMLGMTRRNLVALHEFGRTGLGAREYSAWRSRWEPRQDTSAFVADSMTPEQQAEYRRAHPERKAAWQSSYAAAQDTKGLFPGQ